MTDSDVVRTRCFSVQLFATRGQKWRAAAVALAAWLCMVQFVSAEMTRDQHRFFVFGVAGFALFLTDIGYLIFIRTQSLTLEVTDTMVRLSPVSLPRTILRVELQTWRRLGPSGAVVVLDGQSQSIRLATRLGLRNSRNESWSADGLLADGDVHDLLSALDCDAMTAELAPKVVDASRPTFAGLKTMSPWISTIAFLGVFGGFLGVYFPDVMLTFNGRVAMQTVIFVAIATGLVLTVTGWRRGARQAPPASKWKNAPAVRVVSASEPGERPTFGLAVKRMATWMAASLVGGALVIGPFFAVIQGFQHWVDIPGCAKQCHSLHLQYESYRSNKSGSTCSCASSLGGRPITFRGNYTVTGGTSAGDRVADWVIRTVSILGVGVGTNVALFTAAFAIHEKWQRRKTRSQ